MGIKFQSYISPIQTTADAQNILRNINFNPTLVQFKLILVHKNHLHLRYFNPTLVQFKPRL